MEVVVGKALCEDRGGEGVRSVGWSASRSSYCRGFFEDLLITYLLALVRSAPRSAPARVWRALVSQAASGLHLPDLRTAPRGPRGPSEGPAFTFAFGKIPQVPCQRRTPRTMTNEPFDHTPLGPSQSRPGPSPPHPRSPKSRPPRPPPGHPPWAPASPALRLSPPQRRPGLPASGPMNPFLGGRNLRAEAAGIRSTARLEASSC